MKTATTAIAVFSCALSGCGLYGLNEAPPFSPMNVAAASPPPSTTQPPPPSKLTFRPTPPQPVVVPRRQVNDLVRCQRIAAEYQMSVHGEPPNIVEKMHKRLITECPTSDAKWDAPSASAQKIIPKNAAEKVEAGEAATTEKTEPSKPTDQRKSTPGAI